MAFSPKAGRCGLLSKTPLIIWDTFGAGIEGVSEKWRFPVYSLA
jgi:hypothetical protein